MRERRRGHFLPKPEQRSLAPITDTDIARNRLHKAAIETTVDENLTAVIEHLPENFVHAADVFGKTPLDYAVIKNEPDKIAAFAKAGAELNRLDLDGYSHVHRYVIYNKLVEAEHLLSLGADARIVAKNGKTLLDLLDVQVTQNNEKWWDLLLTYGAGINYDFKFENLTTDNLKALRQVTKDKFLPHATNCGSPINHATPGFEDAIFTIKELAIKVNEEHKKFHIAAFITVYKAHLLPSRVNDLNESIRILNILKPHDPPSLKELVLDALSKYGIYKTNVLTPNLNVSLEKSSALALSQPGSSKGP